MKLRWILGWLAVSLLAVRAADAPPAVSGLRIVLSAEPAKAKAGEPVTFTLTFENVSKEPLRVFWPVDLMVSDAIQLKAEGPDVQRTLVARPAILFIPGPANYPEIAPGGKKSYSIRMEGNPPNFAAWGIFLGAPGRYRIQAAYRYRGLAAEPELDIRPGAPMDFTAWSGVAESNEVEIELVGDFQPVPRLMQAVEPGPLLPVEPDGDLHPPRVEPRPIPTDRPRRTPAD